MDYVRFGKTGLEVSRLCLGCMTYGDPKWREWVLTEDQSLPFFKAAIEKGINFFDTANMYSLGASEEIVGRALKQLARREEVVVATKVFNAMGPKPNQKGLSRKHIREACDASLKRLGMDYIDLYIIHRLDPNTEMEEIAEALDDLVRAGKVLYLGASSMWAWQFMKLIGIQRAKGYAEFVSMQSYYSAIYREDEREMIPLCRSEGIALTPWSPLARGFLAGTVPQPGQGGLRSRTDGNVWQRLGIGSEADYAILARVGEIAERLGVKRAQLALAWVLAQGGITAPIVGVSKPHHLDDAIAALDIRLDAETLAALAEPYRPKAPQGGFA